MSEDAEKSKLIALFSSLEESDKDIVTTMAESLVKKHRNNMTNKVSNRTKERRKR